MIAPRALVVLLLPVLLLVLVGCDRGNRYLIVNYSAYQIDIAYSPMGEQVKWTIPAHGALEITYWDGKATLKITDHASGKVLAPAFSPAENVTTQVGGTPVAKFDLMGH